MAELIYYLPGYGGQLRTGLGKALMDRGFDVTGRETRGDFARMPFSDQVEVVVDDLKTHFWNENARVVANSFGAYLFWHAQTRMASFPGRVLALSPIVGVFANQNSGMNFMPPCTEQLQEAIEQGRLVSPRVCEIHTGSEDWQSEPAAVTALGQAMGVSVTVVPDNGHKLEIPYVAALLERWL